jgi:uncharacterized integral membrane protein
MRNVILILMLALACVMVLFAVQNTQPVTVRFLTFESGQTPLALVMVLSAAAGAALVTLFLIWDQVRHGFRRWRMGRQMSGLERRLVELEGQVATLTQENAALKAGAAPASSQPAPQPDRPVASDDAGALR